MTREYRDYLEDILSALEKIERFTSDFSDFHGFMSDERTFLAVVKLFENVGEAVKNIPQEIRIKYADIPWDDIAGMRDILVHEYFGIDAEVIWKTAVEDVPAIKPQLEHLLNDIEKL